MKLWKKLINWKKPINSKKTNDLEFLPDDCLFYEVFEFLDIKTLLKVRRVCKKWKQFINKTIWNDLIQEEKGYFNCSCSWVVFMKYEKRITMLFDSSRDLFLYLKRDDNKNHSWGRCLGCSAFKRKVTFLEIKNFIKKRLFIGFFKVFWVFIKFILFWIKKML